MNGVHLADDLIVDQALESLRAALAPTDPPARADLPGGAFLRWGDADPRRIYVIPSLTPAWIPLLAERIGEAHQPAVVITRHVSDAASAELRRRGIEFVDTAGNAWLRPGTGVVWISGRRPPPPAKPVPERLGGAAWQVAFVLLRDPALEMASVRALADAAGVSHGAADAALRALHGRGWIQHLGRSGHPIVARAALIEAWRTGFTDRLAPRLDVLTVRPHPEPLEDWHDRVAAALADRRVIVGGELGARLSGHDVHPTTATLYAANWERGLLGPLRLLPDPTGTVVLRRAFSRYVADEGSEVVCPLLLLGELSAVADMRLDPTREALMGALAGRA